MSYEPKPDPRREIQAGSGYWSQNSAVQILGHAEDPAQIEVTWYDGTRDTVQVAKEQNTYLIEHPRNYEGL